MTNLAKCLVAYRQKHDLTQRQLADEIKIGYSTLYRLEKGKDPDLTTFAFLFNWLFNAKGETKDAATSI